MKVSKEILLQQIKEAYAKTRLKLQLGDYFSDDNSCACPVAVIHCAATKSRSSWFASSLARNTFARKYDTDTEWVNHFIHGVDGTGNYGGRNLEEGYKYGEYIRKELLAGTRSVANLVVSTGSNDKF